MRYIYLGRKGLARVKVDDADYQWLSKTMWSIGNGYASRVEGTDYLGTAQTFFMHRVIMDCPEGMMVDHINGDKLDNRRCNLRICSNAENSRNSRKAKNNTSGYKGVTWNKDLQKWVSQIAPDGGNVVLGYFDDPVRAAKAYNAAAVWYFGEFANFNNVSGNLIQWMKIWIKSDRALGRRPNTSGYVGVSWNKSKQKWEAYITKERKRKHLGRFGHKVAAALEYNAAASEIFGSRAKLNKITPSDRRSYRRWLLSRPLIEVPKTNTTGYLGVSPGLIKRKWRATIKRIYLGEYFTREEAAYVVDQVRMQLDPTATNLNVIDKETHL